MEQNEFKRLLYALFPNRCLRCGEIININDDFCNECEKVKPITGEICLRCGREKKYCHCDEEKVTYYYRGVAASYYYEGSIRKAVFRMKNGEFDQLFIEAGKDMKNTVNKRFGDLSFDYITCVPTLSSFFHQKALNHSQLLAEELAKQLGREYITLLKKIRKNLPQKRLGYEARKTNVYGVYDIIDNNMAERINGKTILLVDDLKTTGSTLNECAAVLSA